MKTQLRLWLAGSVLVLAAAAPARAALITYDLTYLPHDGDGENGTGTITIDTSLVNTSVFDATNASYGTFQIGTNFVTNFSLTITGTVAGTWNFADFNGSTETYNFGAADQHQSGGFAFFLGGSNPVDFNQELGSQGVLLDIFPNGTDSTAPFSQGGGQIALNDPFVSGPGSLFTLNLVSITPETSVPEPSTLALAALGIPLLAYRRRRS